MRQQIDWLYRELPRLVAEGVLTPEAADALRTHYGEVAPQGARARWGQILLASFGALLVGGGIILILAHNWEFLARPARAAVALGLLLVAQALAVFAVVRRPESTAWIEATSALLVAAVGAALAVIGQTYHLGGSFEDLLRGWLWLVVLIPYLTGSALASMGFWALLVVRIFSLSWNEMPWDQWLLVVAAFPFVVLRARRRPQSWATSLVVLSASASVFLAGSFLAAQGGWSRLWPVFQVTLLGALLAASAWPPHAEQSGTWRGRLFVPAWIAIVAVGTVLTFDDTWRTGSEIERRLRNPTILGLVLTILGCAAYASVRSVTLAGAGRAAVATCVAAAPLGLVTHALALGGMDAVGWLAFNLWLLAVGALTLYEGVRTLTLGAANRGLLAISLLVIARFFDTEFSFLGRGLAFVALGTACLALNFWLMRRVRRERA